MRRWLMRSALIVTALGVLSCAREHITPTYGRSYQLALQGQQVVRPTGKVAQAATGLDSQEASIVAQGYLRSLARKGVTPEEQPILFVAPSSQAQPRYALPPPSVPQER